MKSNLVLILGLFFLASCGQKKEESSPIKKKSSTTSAPVKRPVNLQLGSYVTAEHRIMNFILPSAYAAVSSAKFCFKRLRFKLQNEDTADINTEDNIDLNLGEVLLSTGGTNLGQVSVKEGTYKRIEFDLENDCDGTTKNSVELINDDIGSPFTTRDRITIKFEGTFIVDGEENLELGVDNILNAMNAYTGSGTLKETLENVSGVL